VSTVANPPLSTQARLRRVGARTAAVSADRAAIALVVVFSAVLAVVTWNTWGDLWLDSGYDLVAAGQVSHANLPYVDFDYWYGPLGPLVLGLVYEVFGIGIAPAVGLGLLTACGAIALAYAVGRRIAGPAAAAVAACLAAAPAFSSSNVSFVQPHAFGATFGILACLAAILLVARIAETGSRRLLLALGVLIGLTALTRHECFGALSAGVGVWLLLRVARATDRRAAWRELALVVGAAAAVGVAGYGSFLVIGTFHGSLTLSQLIHDDLFPSGLVRESVSVVFKTLAPRTPGSFLSLAGHTALYAGGVGGLVLAARGIDAGGRRRIVLLALLGLAALAAVVVVAARPDTARFYLKYAYMWLPAGAAIASVVLICRTLRRRGGWTADDQLAVVVAVMLVGFTYSVYARYWPYPNTGFPQETAYATAVVAAFLAWFHLRELPSHGFARAGTVRALGLGWMAVLAVVCAALVIHDARQETFTVRGVDGAMTATAGDGPMLQRAVDLIESSTQRSDPILLAPQLTSLYVMTGRHDELRQLSLLPGALDGAADEREAIAALQASGVRFAITDRTPLTRYEKGPFGLGYDRLVGDWIRTNFTRITTLHGRIAGGDDAPRTLDVWLRRTL
jgi:Dolichyl-phosphate-mannose-protein mannosyltransferase